MDNSSSDQRHDIALDKQILMRPRVSRLEVILANIDGKDRNTLEATLLGTPWVVIDSDLPELTNVVRDASVPIVLCDGDHSHCWRQMVRDLMKCDATSA